MMQANTLDEVIAQLNTIIDWSIKNNSRIGYFACLYKRMTVGIKTGSTTNLFDNAERMRLLDIVFANRYLDAFDSYINGKPITRAWKIAFDSTKSSNLIAVQHLLLGINTHINLDLGIAASEVTTPDQIQSLKKDFEKVNSVISGLIDEVQNELTQIWFPMKFIDKAVGNTDESLLNFSFTLARKAAWKVATDLASMNEKQKTDYINKLDIEVSIFAGIIINPGIRLKFLLMLVRWSEYGDVKRIIGVLNR